MSGGTKHDQNKAPMDLLSGTALEAVAHVLGVGAQEYGRHNWRKGIAWSRLIAATMRHMTAFMEGEDLDKKTGLPHVDHAMCELMFLVHGYRHHQHLDDRWKDLCRSIEKMAEDAPIRVPSFDVEDES